MRELLTCALLVAAWVSASAQQPSATPVASATPAPRPLKILFVGNSFTHGKYLPVRTYNAKAVTDENAGLPETDPRAHHPVGEEGPFGGIPGIFKKLTDEAGLNYEVHIEAVSAKDLAFHYEHALSLIARPDWDAVVLQGYSTESLPVERGGKPERFQSYALRLEKAIHAVNPHAKVVLEETWPRADLVYPVSAPYHGKDIHDMVTDLRAARNRVIALG